MSEIAQLDTSELDRLVKEADSGIPFIIETVATDVVAQAKIDAPVDTGNLRNSIDAGRVDPKTYRVNVWADYGVFVELGTSKMSAQPFLVPAVERSMNVYVEAWRRFFI